MNLTGVIARRPLFAATAQVAIGTDASSAYGLVSSLEKSSIWSPECRGGTWTGAPGEVGSVFRGENYRAEEVVGWAPLVRGTWFTEAVVLTADPGRTFEWAMLTHTGQAQRSVWGFDVEAVGPGACVLTHRFEMVEATEGIHHIVADLDEADRERFVHEWSTKIESDIAVTLDRIREHLEREALEASMPAVEVLR